MAGDWIKMRTALADDPAVISMADVLDTDEFSVVGRLHHLWSWADAQSRDGHAKGVTQKWINRYVRCDGFAEAMASVHWLELTVDGILFPNFERHNGETAKTRGLATNRKQKQRACVTDESQEMSRTERDEGVTREEKRREEDKTMGDRTDVAAEPRSAVRPSDLSAAMRRNSIEAQPGDPRIIAAAESGISVETIEAACAEAKSSDPTGRVKAGFVVAIAQRWTADAARSPPKGRSPPMRSYHDDRKETIEGLTGRSRKNEHDDRVIDIEPVARLAR